MVHEDKGWLYYIMDGFGGTYYVEDNVVKTSSNLVPLQYTPDGWQDVSIGWERNLERIGVVRNFTIPLKFVNDGAKILKHIVYTFKSEAPVYMYITKQKLDIDPTNYDFNYASFYKGEFDLTSFVDEEDYVTINVLEGGLTSLIKANEATEYEIPIDELRVWSDGVELQTKGAFQMVPDLPINDNSFGQRWWAPVSHLNDDGISVGLDFVSENIEEIPGTMSFATQVAYDLNYLVVSDVLNPAPIPLHLTGVIKFQCTANRLGTWGFRMRFLKESLTVPTQNVYQIFSVPVMTVGTDYTFNIDLIIPMMPGEHLKLEGIFFGGTVGSGTNVEIKYLDNSNLEFAFVNRFKPTEFWAIKPFTLFDSLIKKITQQSGIAVSSLLSTQFDHLVVTSGDAIRGIKNSVIKTSLNDFLQSFNSILNIGIGVINGQVVLESKEFFLDTTSPIALGQSKDVKVRASVDMMFNTIKIGYPDQTYNDVNGKQEYNTTSVFTTPRKRIVKELDLVSNYRADCFGIEYVRINLEGKTTTDNSSDNDTFVINADLTAPRFNGAFPLKRVTYDSISGILSPTTVFNIEDLTPRRMLERHRPWIDALFYGFLEELILFQTNSKNKSLKTSFGGTTITENGVYGIGTFGRLFKPFYFEFQTLVPTNVPDLMNLNPCRCFSFIHSNGRTYTGFNIKIGIAPDSEIEQSYILLSTDDNDILTLR